MLLLFAALWCECASDTEKAIYSCVEKKARLTFILDKELLCVSNRYWGRQYGTQISIIIKKFDTGRCLSFVVHQNITIHWGNGSTPIK